MARISILSNPKALNLWKDAFDLASIHMPPMKENGV